MSVGGVTRVIPDLWDHQCKAVGSVLKHYASCDSSLGSVLTMACGTGKTRVAYELIVHYLQQGHCVIIEPTQELAEQTKDRFEKFGGQVVRLVMMNKPWNPEWEQTGNQVIVCVGHKDSISKIASLQFELIIVDEAHHYIMDAKRCAESGLKALDENARRVYVRFHPFSFQLFKFLRAFFNFLLCLLLFFSSLPTLTFIQC